MKWITSKLCGWARPLRSALAVFLSVAALWPIGSLRAQNVVTDWNTIASTTIVANGGKASVASGVWFAYTFIAVYDAVNAVHRLYQPFYYSGIAPAGASDQAAAAASAHRVLLTKLFPRSTGEPR